MQFAVDLLYLHRSGSGVANFSVLDLNYTGEGIALARANLKSQKGNSMYLSQDV